MSKLSFRARALDPSKPMPIYLAEELPDLPEYSAINRAVPQMPSGMEKEEESEHHLQRAICAGLLIPTPEVTNIEDEAFYDRVYPATYKMPRQLIHMQPLGMDQDIPDYDMDSSDEMFVEQQAQRLDLDVLKFEQMMDKLEKSSGQTVVTLNEAKALLKQDDEVSIAVYDYWLNKRLKTVHPLILNVKTENRGNMAPNDPYLAFRRRTEKMQTRKNRKNDETSYEKMLKLRRDLSRAVSLLEIVKRRETTKRANVQATVDIFEKRFAIKDFSGQIAAEIAASMARNSRPACAPIYSNQYHHGSPMSSWTSSSHQTNAVHHYNSTSYGSSMKQYHHHQQLGDGGGGVNSSSRKEKRQYKKRKHKLQQQKEKGNTQLHSGGTGGYASGASSHHSLHHPHAGSGIIEPMMSSDEDDFNGNNAPGSESEDEGLYSFKRNRNCNYHKPISEGYGNWPWVGKDEHGKADKKYRFTLTSIRHPRPRCIGFARRRMGRGGRIALDRCSTSMDDIWANLDYTIFDSERQKKPTSTIEPLSSSVVMDRLQPAATPFPQQQQQPTTHLSLAAGRVTSVRLSSATSDGTASPLSYATPTQRANSLSVISLTSELMPASQTSDLCIKEEHLDDYERLIDSMRNNNKATMTPSATTTMVHGSGISSGSNLVGSSSSSSSNLRHLHTPPAMIGRGTFSGEFECIVKQEPRLSTDQPPMSQTESRDSGISVKSETPAATDTPMTDLTGDVDIDELLHDVERNWQHFRPKTPVTPPSTTPVDEFTGDFGAEQDAMTRLLTPFNVEMQCLDTLPQNLFADNEETTFVTSEPLALDTLLADDPTRSTNQEGKENDDVNMSGDGFNDFSLGDANDKLVANILEDMENNSKTLSQTSTFFNHLLDGNVPSPEPTNDSEPKSEETIGGYISELVVHTYRCPRTTATTTTTDPSPKSCDCTLCQSNRLGHSHFKVTSQPAAFTKRLLKASAAAATAAIADRTVIKQEEEEVDDTTTINAVTPVIFPAITVAAATPATTTITGIKIKSEPHDELTYVPATTTTGVVFVQQQQQQQQQTQISSADATASHDYAAQQPQQQPQQQQQQHHHQQHHQFVQIIGQTATAIRTPQQKIHSTFTTGDATAVFPTTTTLRPMNGPVLQNLLRYQPQKSQKHEDGQLLADNTKIKHLVKSESNHNPTQSSLQQQQFGILHPNAQIAIIGSTQSSQGGPNRIFLASQPSTSTVDGKLHITTAGGGQSQISTLTSIPSAAIVMDSNAAGKGHTGATVVDSKSGQRVKLETRFFDTSKQQFLYATNFKNNRGGQLLTSKVVNIVPIHSGKNSLITAAAAASSGQQPTTATVLRNKAAAVAATATVTGGDIIQRVGTINNAQNIRPSNNGGNKVISMVTTTTPTSDNKLLANDNTVPGINTTTR